MNTHELIGYLASLLVLMTFCMSGMVALRTLAIASNVAFIAYAALVGISPVLVLHALLLPMNAYRLLQAVRDRRRDGAAVRVLPQISRRLRCPQAHSRQARSGRQTKGPGFTDSTTQALAKHDGRKSTLRLARIVLGIDIRHIERPHTIDLHDGFTICRCVVRHARREVNEAPLRQRF